MGLTRSPPALVSAPTSTPYEAMAASQQAHIDELVQKNRTSEHTIKMLQQKLQEEHERAQDLVSRLKVVSQQERAEWREGCDSLLASHRIVHLRTRIELEKERSEMLKMKEELRKERLATLQRDYKLTLFQAKEADLEHKIVELEELLEDTAEGHAQEADMAFAENQKTIAKLTGQLARANATRQELSEELEALQTEQETLNTELLGLRETHAVLNSSTTSASTKLERTSLQLDGAKSKIAELERANDELKRGSVDLQRQLDRWESLEKKGGAEMEELRKKRIALEVNVKELQARVEELEKSEKDSGKAYEKERKKVAKLDARIASMEELAEEAQNLAAKSQSETVEKVEELEEAQRVIIQLQSQLLEDTAKSLKNKRLQADILPPSSDIEDIELNQPPSSELEVEVAITPAQPKRIQPKPAYKRQEKIVHENKDADPTPRPAKKRKKPPIAEEGDSDRAASGSEKQKKAVKTYDDDELVSAPSESDNDVPARSKGSRRKKAEHLVSKVDNESRPSKDKAKGKAKAEEESEVEEVSVQKSKDDPQAGRSRRGKPGAESGNGQNKPRQTTKEKPKPDAADDKAQELREDEGLAEPQKKKKRKIFASSQPLTFTWDNLPRGDGGLNIPTELSPVKETDVIPQRSIFGSFAKVGSNLTWR